MKDNLSTKLVQDHGEIIILGGLLFAIVVHAKGNAYLRPKHNQPPFSQLVC